MTLSFRSFTVTPLCAFALSLHVSSAAAQQPPAEPAPPAPAPAAPPPAPAPVAAPAEPPPAAVAPAQALPPEGVPPEPGVVNEPELAPPAPEAAVPETPEEPKTDLGPLNLSVWSRVDLVLSNGSSAAPGNFPSGDKLNDVYSTGEFELHASGKVHDIVSLTTNFVASYNSGGAPDGITGTASVMDGIIQIEPSPFFNVWVGRMLVPVDRSNFSGPYFMAPWFYPGFGFADGQVAVPRQGPYGRNDGITAWGQFAGGMFKYYAGAFDLHAPDQSPLFSGRLALSLLNPEPGYYGSSTFHGMDLLGIGVGFQSKEDGSVDASDPTAVLTDNHSEINVDVLFEKDLGSAGVLDLEAAFYKFNGDYEGTDSSWFALASYILPVDVGGGKLQPLLRVQQAKPAADGAPTSTLVDAQIAYILNSYATRFTLGYRNGSADDAKVQALFFGAQVQK